MTPHPTPAEPHTDPTPGLSQPVTAPLTGLVDWSTDWYDCAACGWACEPVTRPVLGSQWGGPCTFHLGVLVGAQHATDWEPAEDYPGHLGWRRATRRLAAVLLRASHGDYTRAGRGQRRSAVWGGQ